MNPGRIKKCQELKMVSIPHRYYESQVAIKEHLNIDRVSIPHRYYESFFTLANYKKFKSVSIPHRYYESRAAKAMGYKKVSFNSS